jgi:predicted XRE-type DNA-binding protein
MDIDTETRHVTKPGANLFLELGFEAVEADALHAESQRRIREAVLLKEQLMDELAGWISANRFRQADAARVLAVSRPRVSDLVNKKAAKFTIDTLIEMLARAGKSVTLTVA